MDTDNSKEEDNKIGWGVTAETISKAAEKAEKLNRQDIIEMLGSAMDSMEKLESDHDKFFLAYQFAFRIYYRLDTIDPTLPLNKIGETRESFLVQNYDYAMFCWAHNRGFSSTIDNNIIFISKDKLRPAEIASFAAKLGSE